jgi:pimeloyl-ACP methyl ester carboxylesterase
VTSNIPVLILSGNLDPVTPPQWGEEVASRLPNSKHVVIANGAHTPDGLTNFECVDQLMQEFLSKGSAKYLDITCVERLLSPPFVTNESK